jgi:hypothetical protein
MVYNVAPGQVLTYGMDTYLTVQYAGGQFPLRLNQSITVDNSNLRSGLGNVFDWDGCYSSRLLANYCRSGHLDHCRNEKEKTTQALSTLGY